MDEVDDALGAARLWSVGIAAEIGVGLAAALGIAAVGTAIWWGDVSILVFSAAGMLSVAAALKFRGSQLTAGR